MDIIVRFTPGMIAAESDIRDRDVVVIDTLRATSTIAAALMAGAREIVPAPAADEAVKIAHRLGADRTLLCGERGARMIAGFHLGNSPREYTPEVVHGKTLVLTTTNGTAALLRCRGASRVVAGALVNARAVARSLADDAQVTFLCAGTNGGLSLEDTIAAGAIIAELVERLATPPTIDDGARVALRLFEDCSGNLQEAIGATDHGAVLRSLGMEEDIAFCSRLNHFDTAVPELDGSMIRLRNDP